MDKPDLIPTVSPDKVSGKTVGEIIQTHDLLVIKFTDDTFLLFDDYSEEPLESITNPEWAVKSHWIADELGAITKEEFDKFEEERCALVAANVAKANADLLERVWKTTVGDVKLPKDLQDRLDKLEALESAGVDSWEGYEEATSKT
jgi:hypothetical protein